MYHDFTVVIIVAEVQYSADRGSRVQLVVVQVSAVVLDSIAVLVSTAIQNYEDQYHERFKLL